MSCHNYCRQKRKLDGICMSIVDRGEKRSHLGWSFDHPNSWRIIHSHGPDLIVWGAKPASSGTSHGAGHRRFADAEKKRNPNRWASLHAGSCLIRARKSRAYIVFLLLSNGATPKNLGTCAQFTNSSICREGWRVHLRASCTRTCVMMRQFNAH